MSFNSSNAHHIKWMIEESEYDLSATDHTFLHQAANLDDPIEFIDYVINKGGSIDAKSPSGYTALHNSILAEKQNSIEKLLDYGADINAQTNDGKTILFLVLDKFWSDDWAYHADIPHDKDKLQSLINYCISLGADLTLKDAQGNDVLIYANSLKQTETYQLEVLKLLAV
jgi:ankyrin repeat protein